MRGRIRSIKPELFDDEELWDLGRDTGLPVLQAFEGLWCYSDREGRFEWRPRALKSKILPYWDGDMCLVLEALASKSFIVRYTVDGKDYGYVRSFKEHQFPNNKEPKSELPSPDQHATFTRDSRDEHATPTRDPLAHEPGKAGTSGVGVGVGSDPGMGSGGDGEPRVDDAPTTPVVIRKIPPDIEFDDELRSDAIAAGCDRSRLDERWRDLKRGPIGGRRGIFAHELRGYIRDQFGKWRTWDETDRANQRAGPQRAGSRGSSDVFAYALNRINEEESKERAGS